jgi:hypothetical protein
MAPATTTSTSRSPIVRLVANQASPCRVNTNLYWTYQSAPGRTAGTVETKDVDFGAKS